MKINEVLDIYTEHLPNTISEQRALIAINHLRALGKRSIRNVAAAIQGYITKRNVSAGTINREVGVLQTALRYSFKRGNIDYLPILQKLPSPPPRSQFLTEEDVAILLSETKDDPVMDKFVRISLMTGQRREAVLTLRWDQVDFKANLIDFNDHTARLSHRMKGRGVVPMSTTLRSFLMGLGGHSGYVVSGTDKPRGLGRKWATLMGHTKFKITPHVLRHTVATQLAQKSVPMTQIARILGHRNSQITERVYAKFSPDFCKEAVEHLCV
jgi:integrase